ASRTTKSFVSLSLVKLTTGSSSVSPFSTSRTPGLERVFLAGFFILPVRRKCLINSSSSSLRSLEAAGMPISSAKAFISTAYQYPLSNCLTVMDFASLGLVILTWPRCLSRSLLRPPEMLPAEPRRVRLSGGMLCLPAGSGLGIISGEFQHPKHQLGGPRGDQGADRRTDSNKHRGRPGR